MIHAGTLGIFTPEQMRVFDWLNAEYHQGLWLTGAEFGAAAGVSSARISKIANDGKIPRLVLGPSTLYRVETLAERYPNCEAARAWAHGPEWYLAWAKSHLKRD